MRSLPGFSDPNVDLLVKVGGSLFGDLSAARAIAEVLDAESARSRVVAFPGGGPIDNYIEAVDRELHFEPEVHHQLCARAQDQVGLMLAALAPRAATFTHPVELPEILDAGALAVMLPMRSIIELDVFARTWDVTSDLMSAYFAHLLGAKRFAILTNVDGVYADADCDGDPLKVVDASDLSEATSVDATLPAFLRATGMECAVLNGLRPDWVEAWLAGEAEPGTTVLPN
jgi:aspartokinase-like uncharacterized kinase